MDIEERFIELERRLAATESRNRALCNQFVALQLVLIRLLPVISEPAAERPGVVIDEVQQFVRSALSTAEFAEEDIADVLSSLDCLREEIAGDANTKTHSEASA